MGSPRSTQTLSESGSPAPSDRILDLSVLPPIFVLATHLGEDELHEVESKFSRYGANLTYDIKEARLAFGQLEKKARAQLELRCLKLWTKEVPATVIDSNSHETMGLKPPPAKRRRLDVKTKADVPGDESTTDEEDDRNAGLAKEAPTTSSPPSVLIKKTLALSFPSDTIKVIKLKWLDDALTAKDILPLQEYLVYEGQHVENFRGVSTPVPRNFDVREDIKSVAAQAYGVEEHLSAFQFTSTILERAMADAGGPSQPVSTLPQPRKFGIHYPKSDRSEHHQVSHLPLETTAEHDGDDSDMPPEPEWVKSGVRYACQRITPSNPPNQTFIDELKQIRLARILTMDEIGVRAYSTSIAAVAAYPYEITTARELVRLPGCEVKIANLWVEWKNTGTIQEAEKTKTDETLVKLNLFYNIWGVGAQTANQFYFDRGWQDLDDVIEYGWNDLHRVQQIGVKYYDEFLDPIPRSEVESIASVIRTHAIKVRDPGIELVVVGGHRRGKDASGDVDVIVSHRNLDATQGLARDIVISLEKGEWITHTLFHSEHNSQRGQSTLPFKASGAGGGHGFDSLDKALVVWQDPQWPNKKENLKGNPKAKNPNIHRRVDIIISPWRTVGCAIMGWSGGTTFQRDVRRYAKNVKNWKFDSSGVRNRGTGLLVPLEGPDGVSGSWQDAERKVFEGLGLEYREAWERCTN